MGRARLNGRWDKTRSLRLVLALLAATACSKKAPQGANTDGGVSSVQDAASPPVVVSKSPTPASTEDSGLKGRPLTTSWSIAGSNFNAQIRDREDRKSARVDDQLFLVELYLERGQYLGTVADFERSKAIGAQLVKSYPNDGLAHFTHAIALGSLHEFGAEATELDAAAKLGAPAQRVTGARVAMLMALGRYDEAAKLIAPVGDHSRPAAKVMSAMLAARMQKNDEADRLFDDARSKIIDVSPFAVAWMDFQRGMALEAQGKESTARSYYIEALQAIPVYVHAAVHLEPTDEPDVAIARLTPLKALTTDPEVAAALAAAHKRAKHDDEAKKLTAEAGKRYDELIAAHPAAYSDHAARFWLAGGNNPKKALDLAAKNAHVRQTEEAIDLWMAAAAAVNDKAQICASAITMKKLPYASESRKRLAAAASTGCPDVPVK